MTTQDKRKLFQQHLQQQNKKRQLLNQQKKSLQSNQLNPDEDMLFIQKTFRQKQKFFQQSCQQYKKKSITFQQLKKILDSLKQYYVEINYVLMTYDRQVYKEIIQKLYTTMIELKRKYEPRKKFKFSRRDEDFGVKVEGQTEEQKIERLKINQDKINSNGQNLDQNDKNSFLNIPGLTKLTNQTLKINTPQQKFSSYKITQCSDTSIQLLNTTQILFLKQLKNCQISCALTKSTVFVDNCTNCTFQLNCHQLRIHNTYDSTFKIFVTSKAIIQDCNNVIFEEYGYDYQNKEKDQEQFERKNVQNLWRDIQDFNWLKEGQKSPHYTIKEKV